MTCPTPAINIQHQQPFRETTERIMGEAGEGNTIIVKGKFLTVRDTDKKGGYFYCYR